MSSETYVAKNAQINVLLVEDSPSDARLVEEVLRSAPSYSEHVLIASTLAQALKLLSTHSFDVILLDLALPDSQGIDTFRAVKQKARIVPIIALTMTGDDALGQQMVHEGAQDYLPKGALTQDIASAILAHMIRYAIERKQIETALVKSEQQYRSLSEDAHELNKQLRTANEKLEGRVQERTKELQTLNEELRHEIEQRAKAERIAVRHARWINTFNQVVMTGNAANTSQAALSAMISMALKSSGYDAGAVFLINEAEGVTELKYEQGCSARFADRVRHMPLSLETLTRIYRGEPIFMENYPREGTPEYKAEGMLVAAGVPLMVQDRVIGHYVIFSKTPHHITDEERAVLVMVGREAGTIIARLQAEEQVRQYTNQLEGLVEERTAQLKDAERLAAIGQTAAMIGHDLRNPLQALQFALELERKYFETMPKTARATPNARKAVHLYLDMEQQIQYMDKIVSDLQDYARPLKLHLEKMRFTDLVDETLSVLTIPGSIRVHVNAAPRVTVTVDRYLAQRMLSNLVINALQAMPEGGDLTIGASPEAGVVRLTIHDTGEGVPYGMRETLFSPLTTGKAKGTGLGLAVVKRIVEAHNGTITFTSEEENGTTFTVTLPRMDE